MASKDVKLAKDKITEEVIFKLFSLGVITARDEWVYDVNKKDLKQKILFLHEVYNHEAERLAGKVSRDDISDQVDYTIKWTRAVKNDLAKGKLYAFRKDFMSNCLYRPFIRKSLYFSKELNEMQYQLPIIFPDQKSENIVIAVNVGNKPFNVLASKWLVDYHFNGDSQCFPLYRYDRDGERRDNITDWALKQFQSHYHSKTITRLDIFHYVYAVLHDPTYREKYHLNLRREFPRIPFHEEFRKWSDWGKRLMELHIGFEQEDPYPLKRIDKKPEPDKTPLAVKPILKADRAAKTIQLDSVTTLQGVPPAAWEYQLGNRCAIEWVLEYHKERKPKDPTIRAKFNTYRFADHKEEVIDLLRRVCQVSVETITIIKEMGSKNKGFA